MTVTPPTVPVRVKRRLTPENPLRPRRIASAGTLSWSATAMAAVALSALCSPGMGSSSPSMRRCVMRMRSRISTAKR